LLLHPYGTCPARDNKKGIGIFLKTPIP